MNDLHRLFEDAAPEPVRELSVDAVVIAARRRRRLQAGAVGLALALVLGGVGTAFAVTRDGGSQVLRPVQTPAPTTSPPATASTVFVGLIGGRLSCAYVVLSPRTVPGPATVDAALRSLLSGLTPQETAAGNVTSLFGPGSAGLLRSVKTMDGVTVIDLDGGVRGLITEPSSCQPQQLSAQVNRTLEPYRPYLIRVDGDAAQGAALFGGPGSPRASVTIALNDPSQDRGPQGSACSGTVTVARPVEDNLTPTSALRALFTSPPDPQERARGLVSAFDSRTTGILRSVHIVDGVAYVDLADIQNTIPNVSTSCGAAGFRSQILQTLTPYGAQELRLAINGDPRVMADFLQAGCKDPVGPGDPCDPAPFATPSPFGSVTMAFPATEDPDGIGSTRLVTRDVLGPATAKAALRLLFAGPTPAEREQGLSDIGSSSAGLLRSVHQRGSTFYIDLDADTASRNPCLGNEGCVTFGGPVLATLSQLGPVKDIFYALNGDVRRFVEQEQGVCAEPGVPPPGKESATYDCNPAPFLN